MTTLIERSRDYAISRHQARNQMYGEHPYSFHLEQVVAVAQRYTHLFQLAPLQGLEEVALAGCWVHDVIEDTGESYNDVLKATSEGVAEIAFALTTPKGRTRKERHCKAYYDGICITPGAVFVKICDRLANVTHSKSTGSRMFALYQKEAAGFEEMLWFPEYAEMFEELQTLMA